MQLALFALQSVGCGLWAVGCGLWIVGWVQFSNVH